MPSTITATAVRRHSVGGDGDDRIVNSSGADVIDGGPGIDSCSGGPSDAMLNCETVTRS